MTDFRNIVSVENVETQVFDWGKLQWLSEPRVTGSQVMTTGIVTLAPGKGHERHNHPGSEEILFVLKGKGVQTIYKQGGEIKQEVQPGDLIHLDSGQFHATHNTGDEDLVLLAVYEHSGPEAALRADPACTVVPPQKA